MRIGSLVAVIAALTSHAALADVKRVNSMPESLRGSWAPSVDVCKNADNSVIVLSARTYVSSQANCTVASISETAGARGPIYSARLQCSDPGTQKRTASNLIIRPDDMNQISVGADFGALKIYRRCPASEPAATR